jgi:hypothetical protein
MVNIQVAIVCNQSFGKEPAMDRANIVNTAFPPFKKGAGEFQADARDKDSG